MSIGRRISIVIAAGAFALSAPAAALACLPYTYAEDEDHFKLADGVQWAFVADVIDEVPNPEVPDRPQSMVLEVRETIAGSGAPTRPRIDQDDGCHGFWYRKGDRVIAAIGQMPGIAPPFTGITNYQISVWVIRDGVVDATIRAHWIGGRRPETERELRAALGALPDTATMEATTSPAPTPAVAALVAMATILTAILTVRAIGRKRP